MQREIVPVILSGGAGARLWPVSREAHPKPFLKLVDGQSLLQKTFLRLVNLPSVAGLVTVTNREYYFLTRDEFLPVNNQQVPCDYLLEPCGRNTAAAVCAAAMFVQRRYGPQSVLLIAPSDHLIIETGAFADAVEVAVAAAETGDLVTFGMHPETPETGYGYIEAGEPLSVAGAYRVRRFVEKPDLATAQSYLAQGGFFWNSGMFCFQAGVLLAEMQRHAPEVYAGVLASLPEAPAALAALPGACELTAASFAEVPDISIDYAVMEKAASVAVVPCELGWSDIGSWSAVGGLTPPDADGNRIDGEAYLHDVRDCYVRGDTRLVGLVGVSDLVVVDTPDALLVADRERVQEVKQIVQSLKAKGHEAYRLHRTVARPWGTYTVLEEAPRFKIKRIVVRPGAALSLQMHHHRSEHWVVVAGVAKVINGEREFVVNVNESTFIPAGCKHRLSNPGLLDLVMIEVQTGDYVGEDDIVRFDDRYGR